MVQADSLCIIVQRTLGLGALVDGESYLTGNIDFTYTYYKYLMSVEVFEKPIGKPELYNEYTDLLEIACKNKLSKGPFKYDLGRYLRRFRSKTRHPISWLVTAHVFSPNSMVVAVKVFKKTTPNGKVTVYLSKRDFIDHLDHTDPIDGVVVVEDGYLQGRKVFGQVLTVYRYGREEDEIMGVKFSKEMVVASDQLVPCKKEKQKLTAIQEKLIAKLGANAHPFTFQFPEMSPCSVTLQPGENDEGKPLGVEYFVKCYVSNDEELPKTQAAKRSTLQLAIKKLQFAPTCRGPHRLPSSLVSKGFTFSSGKINLEVTLDKDVYYHGEKIGANIMISNNSRKPVRNIKVYVVQHCEVTMVNAQFSKYVASLETREGCPITPGASFTKVVYLIPLASSNKDRRGVALDGRLRDDDANLASSTLVPDGKCPIDAIGIVISYSLRVKLNCGTLGGELVTDVPFKLLHPIPGTVERERAQVLKKLKSMDQGRYEQSFANDDEDNIVFEDFARFRLSRDELE